MILLINIPFMPYKTFILAFSFGILYNYFWCYMGS